MSALARCSPAVLAAALLAGGCSSLLPDPGAEEAALFSVRGGVVTQIGSEPPQRSLFHWSRLAEGGKDRLTVMSPAGVALFRVERDADGLRFRDAAGRVTEGEQARLQFSGNFGWELPLDEAAYWIRCKPHPGSSAVERFTFKGKMVVEQGDWTVECTNLDEEGRPLSIRMEGRHAVMRVEIAEWM